jgi:nucleoid DNA-binding protein
MKHFILPSPDSTPPIHPEQFSAAAEANLHVQAYKRVLIALAQIITAELQKNVGHVAEGHYGEHYVVISGLGTFSVRRRPERHVRKPKTRLWPDPFFHYPPANIVKFRPSYALYLAVDPEPHSEPGP